MRASALNDGMFALSRIKRAVLNRFGHEDLRVDGQAVRFTGIANFRGRTASYASPVHFRYDIPMVRQSRHHAFLVAQNYLDDGFLGDTCPKVWFSREPLVYLDARTRALLERADVGRFVLSFGDPDIRRRMFYVALPGDRDRVLLRLERGLDLGRPRLCCMVNRYKEDARFDLLEERRRFARAMGGDIDIYGHRPWHGAKGWEDWPSYRGPARDKLATLRAYAFNLCFENCDEDGYITEKIIHAMMAGCVPLYWGGGRYLAETIPAGCFIDCRGCAPEAIHERVRAMTHEEIVSYRRAGLAFLASPGADRFTWRYWADQVIGRWQEQG